MITINIPEVIHFSSIEEIPKEYYNSIVYLNCYNCNINNIDFIKDMPNLIKLIASNNYIKDLPYHDKLEYVDINTNQISVIPEFPNIKELYIFANNIINFPYLSTLEILDISNNFLKELKVPYNIIKLYCNYNNITKLVFIKNTMDDRLVELNISNNQIANINFIFNFKKIQSFIYDNNNIDYIPPYIERYIMIKLYNYKYQYYNNYHPLSIDEMKSILSIMDINYKPTYIDIIDKLNPNAQKLIKLYSDYDFVHKKMLITFQEVFDAICSYYIYCYSSNNIDNLIDKLNKLYSNNPSCKCTSCLIIDIISIL